MKSEVAAVPPFQNHEEFVTEIEAKIEPNRHFPYVKLEHLDYQKMNLGTSQTLKSQIRRKSNIREAQKTPRKKGSLGPNQGTSSKCPVCKRGFGNQRILGMHILAKHKEVIHPFFCSCCSSSFKTNDELKSHLVTQHSDQFRAYHHAAKKNSKDIFCVQHLTLQCPHCPQKFAYQCNLKRHIKSHSTERPHICKTCGSSYKTSFGLFRHQDEQKCQSAIETVASRRFNCQEANCGKAFKHQAVLTQHLRIIHGMRPEIIQNSNICLFCGYDAKTPGVLKVHNRIHTGEKPFKCKGCGTTMSKKNNMIKHQQLHCSVLAIRPSAALNQRSLSCTKCAQSFKTVGERNWHEKSHGDQFPCPYCPTGFNRLNYLNRHKTVIHSVSACNICEVDFLNPEDLEVHKEEVHIVYETEALSIDTKSTVSGQTSWSESNMLELKGFESAEKAMVIGSSGTVVKRYGCKTCGSTFKYESNLRTHRISNVCESILARCVECKNCGIFLSNQVSFKVHQVHCLGTEKFSKIGDTIVNDPDIL